MVGAVGRFVLEHWISLFFLLVLSAVSLFS
jgi:hypothetical protein